MVSTFSLFDDTNQEDERANAPSKAIRRGKSATAYRTISEVAEELNVASHVLRFWETKFPEISPMKRGGGRRYYRPEDIILLKQIQTLLYDEGYTIRGVQSYMKRGGAKSEKKAAKELAKQVGVEASHNKSLLKELQDIRRVLDE